MLISGSAFGKLYERFSNIKIFLDAFEHIVEEMLLTREKTLYRETTNSMLLRETGVAMKSGTWFLSY